MNDYHFYPGICKDCRQPALVVRTSPFPSSALCRPCMRERCLIIEPAFFGEGTEDDIKEQIFWRLVRATYGVLGNLPIITEDEDFIALKKLAAKIYNRWRPLGISAKQQIENTIKNPASAATRRGIEE